MFFQASPNRERLAQPVIGWLKIELACLNASWRDLRRLFTVRNSGRILLVFIFLPASVIAAGQTVHDVKITTRHGSGSNDFTITEYYSGENSRSDVQTSSGNVKGHHRALIRKKSAEGIQVYDLNLDAHEYVGYRTDVRASCLGQNTSL
jgi:hypothetical protein